MDVNRDRRKRRANPVSAFAFQSVSGNTDVVDADISRRVQSVGARIRTLEIELYPVYRLLLDVRKVEQRPCRQTGVHSVPIVRQINFVRAGEHFVLRYLKRGGRPTGERYVLVWLDGDILYYGSDDRITILALDTQTDTLMVSPGEDYTRQSENER